MLINVRASGLPDWFSTTVPLMIAARTATQAIRANHKIRIVLTH